MGLETGTYISDLNASNPIDATDVVGQGDDHLRLIKSTILNTFPNITGAVTVSHTKINELANVTIEAGKLTLNNAELEDTGTAVVLRNLAASQPLQLQVNATELALSAAAGGDTVVYANNLERLRALAAGGVTSQGVLTVEGNRISLANDQAADASQRIYNAAGGLGMRGLANGDGSLDQISSTGAIQKQAAYYTRNGGWLFNVNGVNSFGSPALGTFEVEPSATANVGARVTVKGEGANPDAAIDNDSGNLRMLVNDNATEAAVWSDTGALSQKAAAEILGKLTVSDADVDQDNSVSANETRWLMRNSEGGFKGKVNGNAVSWWRTDSAGVDTAAFLVADAAGQLDLYGNNAVRARILAAAVANSYGQIWDASNTAKPIGYNILPTQNVPSGGSRDLADTDCGRKLRLNAAGLTMTAVDSLTTDFACMIYNESNGDCTIAQGAGITLTFFSGAGKVNGDYTIASGEAVLLTKRGTSTTWFIS